MKGRIGMDFNPLSVTKVVISGLVGIGTGKIVASIIKNNITPETILDKVTVTAAAWVIGAIVSEATKDYTNEMVDTTAASIDKIVEAVTTSVKLSRVNKGKSTLEKEGLDPNEFAKNDKNVWVVNKSEKTIDINTVIGMIRSSDWKYDVKKDVWFHKDSPDKAFKKNKKSDGSTEWVWGKLAL